jgi:hypothetical protein
MNSEVSMKQVADLLGAAGIKSKFILEPIAGGANNRVYKLFSSGSYYLLKAYFLKHQGDQRDRLKTEYSFISFAWAKGLRSIPAPIAIDRQNNLALYQFIHGDKFQPGDVAGESVNQALRLFTDLNKFCHDTEAAGLPEASEACFSLSEHLNMVEKRIDGLHRIIVKSAEDEKAQQFIESNLTPTWVKVKSQAEEVATAYKIDPSARTKRSISPSDFGFHNALVDKSGKVFFIDFEYAGWDDAAKMVCDFFCQPAVPVPRHYFNRFARGVVATLTDPDLELKRIEILLPVYKVKWCCILLNEYLPAGKARRGFAFSHYDYERKKGDQLTKAKIMLEGIKM